MAASVRRLRPVQASATDVLTWDYRHVYIGREKSRTGLRRPVQANSHEFEGDVDREEATRRFHQDVVKSVLLLTQLPDIAETFFGLLQVY